MKLLRRKNININAVDEAVGGVADSSCSIQGVVEEESEKQNRYSNADIKTNSDFLKEIAKSEIVKDIAKAGVDIAKSEVVKKAVKEAVKNSAKSDIKKVEKKLTDNKASAKEKIKSKIKLSNKDTNLKNKTKKLQADDCQKQTSTCEFDEDKIKSNNLTTKSNIKTSETENLVDDENQKKSNVRFVPKKFVPKLKSKKEKLDKIIYIWTLFSALYAIVSTSAFIVTGWVEGVVSYILIAILTLYIIIFIALIILTRDNQKRSKKSLKYFKTTIKLFKSSSNVVYVALSAVSLVGVASLGFEGLEKIAVFIFTLFVAVTKLVLKTSKFGIKLNRKRIAKKYKVEVTSYLDGKAKKSLTNKVIEKTYK